MRGSAGRAGPARRPRRSCWTNHLLSGQNPDGTTNALAEAVASPTDVVGGFVGGPPAPVPNVTKDRFNVNVRIENNDMLFAFKSDSTAVLTNVVAWLQGSNTLNGKHVSSPDFDGLMRFQTMRLQFTQPGLPRKIVDQAGFEFAPLQRFGRTSTGVPLHQRVDGPGFNGMDVPAFEEFPGGRTFAAGTSLPKLEFSVFMPTSESFRQMRVGVAAQDLQGGSPLASPYSASKHGVIGLTKVAALEYASAGIRVNAVCPGAIDTPMMEEVFARFPGYRETVIQAVPFARLGRPAEVAAAVVWLWSDSASFITGQALPVEGGLLAQ